MGYFDKGLSGGRRGDDGGRIWGGMGARKWQKSVDRQTDRRTNGQTERQRFAEL